MGKQVEAGHGVSEPRPNGGEHVAQRTDVHGSTLPAEVEEGHGASEPQPSRSFVTSTFDWMRHPKGGLRNRAVAALLLAVAVLSGVGSWVANEAVVVNGTQNNVEGTQINGTQNSGDQSNYYGPTYFGAEGAPGPAGSQDEAGSSCSDDPSDVRVGWGPDRPTFSSGFPPLYTTINAIRDNPNYGDERGMVTVKDSALSDAGGWTYRVEAQRDRTYLVRIYVENSAADDVEELASLGTRVKVNLPTCMGRSIGIGGFIMSDTAYPQEVYGGVTLHAAEEFNLVYVDGSAEYTSNTAPDGVPISDTFLTSDGAMIGNDELNGVLMPGYQHDGFITFQVRAQFAKS